MSTPADALPLAVERAGEPQWRAVARSVQDRPDVSEFQFTRSARRPRQGLRFCWTSSGGAKLFRRHWQMPTIVDATWAHGSVVKTRTGHARPNKAKRNQRISSMRRTEGVVMLAPADALPRAVERAGEPRWRQAVARSDQDRCDVAEFDK
jgi:hypothetical protein